MAWAPKNATIFFRILRDAMTDGDGHSPGDPGSGNTGGGKSTLGRRLAGLTGLPLYVVDMMQFRPGGAAVPHNEFLQAHADLLRRDEWIIDGFGDMATAWERFAAADTLVYVDLPLSTHFDG